MPSVKLALDHVNEHSDILSNYRLHMWWNDTQVNIQISMLNFNSIILNICLHSKRKMKCYPFSVISAMQRSA